LRLDISLSSSGKDTFRFEATRIRARWRSGMRMHPQHAKAVKYLIDSWALCYRSVESHAGWAEGMGWSSSE
jgi:hypothetical protein